MADEEKFPSLSRAGLDRRGTIWGLLGVAVLLALTFIGSDGLVWFDAALVGYLFGMVFGVIYRCTVWIKRPPTGWTGPHAPIPSR